MIISLCGEPECCGYVDMREDFVIIGNDEGFITLSNDEWNILKRYISESKL